MSAHESAPAAAKKPAEESKVAEDNKPAIGTKPAETGRPSEEERPGQGSTSATTKPAGEKNKATENIPAKESKSAEGKTQTKESRPSSANTPPPNQTKPTQVKTPASTGKPDPVKPAGKPAAAAAKPPPPPPPKTIKAEDLLREDPTPVKPSLQAAKQLTVEIPMTYGSSTRPAFTGDEKFKVSGIADLPRALLPSPTSPEKRLVIVGDVHGQLSALKSLLEKVAFQRGGADHLILAGDMVSKGPDSAGVVQLAMDLGASAVRGNHEDRILLAYREMEAKISSLSSSSEEDDENKTSLSSSSSSPSNNNTTTEPKPQPSPGMEADVAIAAQLTKKQLKWLASLPIILRMGPLPDSATHQKPWNAGTIAVVHAGLVPGVPLEEQDLRAAMTMRSLVYPAEAERRARIKKELEKEIKAKLERLRRGRKVEGRPLPVKDAAVDAELRRLERELGFDRALDRRVWYPVEGRNGDPWSEVWSRYMSEKVAEEKDRTVVVYGHDAKAGLRVGEVQEEAKFKLSTTTTTTNGTSVETEKKKKKADRYAFGLDSGCVYGRQLTALVLEVGSDGTIGHNIVQVDCEKAAELKD
jgi:hypothetical protein